MAEDLPDSYFSENRVAPYFGWRQMGGGGIVAPDLFPMLIDERGSRRNRIWEQIRTPL